MNPTRRYGMSVCHGQEEWRERRSSITPDFRAIRNGPCARRRCGCRSRDSRNLLRRGFARFHTLSPLLHSTRQTLERRHEYHHLCDQLHGRTSANMNLFRILGATAQTTSPGLNDKVHKLTIANNSGSEPCGFDFHSACKDEVLFSMTLRKAFPTSPEHELTTAYSPRPA